MELLVYFSPSRKCCRSSTLAESSRFLQIDVHPTAVIHLSDCRLPPFAHQSIHIAPFHCLLKKAILSKSMSRSYKCPLNFLHPNNNVYRQAAFLYFFFFFFLFTFSFKLFTLCCVVAMGIERYSDKNGPGFGLSTLVNSVSFLLKVQQLLDQFKFRTQTYSLL